MDREEFLDKAVLQYRIRAGLSESDARSAAETLWDGGRMLGDLNAITTVEDLVIADVSYYADAGD